MTKRTTATQRRAERRRQLRDEIVAARSERADAIAAPEFGVAMGRGLGGRPQLKWTMDRDPFHALIALAHVRGVLLSFEREFIRQGREQGLSWDQLGFALDVTGESVRKRYVEP